MRQLCYAVIRSGGVIAAAAGALAGMTVVAAPAQAHEELELGSFTGEIGWADEPAYTGSPNRIQLTLANDAGEPVTDLGDSVSVEVVFGDGEDDGGERMELPLTATPDAPGDYGADLVPTRPGTYTFRIFGSINGEDVDTSVTSGPDTFEEPREPTDIQFPVADLSNAQLNERLDRELERFGAAPEAADTSADTSDGGGDGAGTVLGIVGIVVGAIGVAGAGLALRRTRALA